MGTCSISLDDELPMLSRDEILSVEEEILVGTTVTEKKLKFYDEQDDSRSLKHSE